jgi:flavorubredoxin
LFFNQYKTQGEKMKKVLIAYVSRTGNTERMANYIAEGVRFSGNEPVLQKTSAFKNDKELAGYDAYIFGCPTYHKDMTSGMKQFLFLASNLKYEGKTGGAFGSHTHSGESAPMIFDTMEHVLKIRMTDLGPLNLTEAEIATDEGLKACQAYGKALGENL